MKSWIPQISEAVWFGTVSGEIIVKIKSTTGFEIKKAVFARFLPLDPLSNKYLKVHWQLKHLCKQR